MSEEFRPIEIVDVGRGEPTPPRPPRDRTGVLLSLIAAGVLVGAGCSAFAAWTVYQTQQDNRLLNCHYLTGFPSDGSDGVVQYDDLPEGQQELVDRLDCDVAGR